MSTYCTCSAQRKPMIVVDGRFVNVTCDVYRCMNASAVCACLRQRCTRVSAIVRVRTDVLIRVQFAYVWDNDARGRARECVYARVHGNDMQLVPERTTGYECTHGCPVSVRDRRFAWARKVQLDFVRTTGDSWRRLVCNTLLICLARCCETKCIRVRTVHL